MVYVGVDLGGTGIKAGVVDGQGRMLSRVECPTLVERGHEPVVHDMAMLALRAVEESGRRLADVHSVGVGIPGIMDPATGIVPFCTNLAWHQVPLVKLMQRVIDKPIFVENDATVAGLAESVAGVSAGCQNSVFLTLGTGVGGGIVLNGKVYSGPHGVASELGHMIVMIDGEECTCGNKGCWERYASATALIRMGREAAKAHPKSALNASIDNMTAKAVVDAAKAGDAAATEVFDRYTYFIALGLVNIVNFLDPEIIALGGGVSAAGEFLLKPVREKLKAMVFYKDMPYARVELAKLGNDAGIIGAAMLGRI
ncbi:MAG: ROK family protein [Clostridiales bacterium]|nr:ROK family protein [Clostridiales bacterium]